MVTSTYGGWYVGKIHAAADTVGPNSYADSVNLDVPADTGYHVFVYYRATSGDPWGIYGMSSGTVDVTAASFSAITVTAPTGTTSQAQGAALPVTWTTNASVATGEFSIWVVSRAGTWARSAPPTTGRATPTRSPSTCPPTPATGVRLLPRHQRRPLGDLRMSSGRST